MQGETLKICGHQFDSKAEVFCQMMTTAATAAAIANNCTSVQLLYNKVLVDSCS